MKATVALGVFQRDQGCIAPQLGGSMMDCWGRLTIEHVKRQLRAGKRAESVPECMVTLCQGHTEPGMRAGYAWNLDKRNRALVREYLAGLSRSSAPTATSSSGSKERNGGAAMPVRLQRRRTKGYRLPSDAIYVGRGSPWGNKYRLGRNPWYGEWRTIRDVETVVELFRKYAQPLAAAKPEWLAPLRGKDLACWCPLDQPCHADVLLELANE